MANQLSIIEIHKANKRTDKIMNFLSEKFPEVMYIFSQHADINEEVNLFFQTFCDIVEEFTIGSKKNLDFKTFPWKEEVKKRMIENYGYFSTT